MSEEATQLQRLPRSAPELISDDPVVEQLTDKESDKYASEKRELELEGGRYELSARKLYAKYIFWLVAAWIAAVLALIFVAGYTEKPLPLCASLTGPKISDGVLIALITGMSVNVIGLLAIVINYLFPKRPN